MDTLEQKQQENKSTNDRMFDLTEKYIMQYVADQFKLTPEEIFMNTVGLSNIEKPLILNPITAYSDKILVLYVDIVPYDYKCDIPEELLKEEVIISMIGFIYHSMINVYNALLSSNIKKEIIPLFIEKSTNLEMDDDALTFYSTYLFPKHRQMLILEKMKTEMETVILDMINELKNNMELTEKESETMFTKINEFTTQLSELKTQIENIHYDDASVIKIEDEVNASFEKNQRIGIIYKEYTKEEISEKYNI